MAEDKDKNSLKNNSESKEKKTSSTTEQGKGKVLKQLWGLCSRNPKKIKKSLR